MRYSCSNTGRIERDGKFYCGIHDPEAEKARRAKHEAKWRAKWDEEKKAHEANRRRQEFGKEAIGALQLIAAGHNDPRRLAADLIAKFEPAGGNHG
jgi:glycine/D-amino acid oxidase-like deaminating enzyme